MKAGMGLRQDHYHHFLDIKPDIDFIEVHSENFFACEPALELLLKARENYPVSLHGIGNSLGSSCGLNPEYLKCLKSLVDIVQPSFISDHLSFSAAGGAFVPDLLPINYTKESLEIFSNNLIHMQEYIGQQIFVENPSSYLTYKNSYYSETEYLNLLCQITGCKILLDVNNIYVSSINHGWDANEYLSQINPYCVGEMHLAGHTSQTLSSGRKMLIDTHDTKINDDVWRLYDQALERFGPQPTLIEWDANLPEPEVLLGEVRNIQSHQQKITKQHREYA